ncbi:unnamed protein product [Durusdinium trenchii]|uniref:ER membrane protein complex subunit 4 n=1 Tax=Durusdinium trenchii TaxID=1381693 RepID=A0ABP0SW96_9DINO
MTEVSWTRWDFSSLDTAGSKSVDGAIQDPIGYRLTMDDGNAAGKNKSKTANQELLEKKAWEVAVAPIQSVGMNFFFLWMSGSSPGIFTIMILGYCLTSIVGQFAKANAAFQNFKTIDTTLQVPHGWDGPSAKFLRRLDSVDSKCRSYRNCRWHRKVSVKCSLRCPSFTAFMH